MLKYESKESSFGLGHRFFGILPGLVIWSTVFLREHNTVCDQLTEEHPHWTDEQIFQTARNAIAGDVYNVSIVVQMGRTSLTSFNNTIKRPMTYH